jgi:hypothetical protein
LEPATFFASYRSLSVWSSPRIRVRLTERARAGADECYTCLSTSASNVSARPAVELVRTPIAVVEPPTGDDVPDTARERGEMISEPTSLGTDQARRAGLKATQAMDC